LPAFSVKRSFNVRLIGRNETCVRPTFKAGRSYEWPAAVSRDVLRAFENKLNLFRFLPAELHGGWLFAENALVA